MSGWALLTLNTGGIHLIPVADLRDHECTDCWCSPLEDEENGVPILAHNAMDRREQYERGELRAH